MSEEEKVKLCCALNYEKLSAETCINLSENIRFPSTSSIQALISEQLKLKTLLQTANSSSSITSLPCKLEEKLDFPEENEKLKAHIQGIQWRVMELEHVCKKIQTQMTKMMKSKVTNDSQLKSLPWLCS